MTRARTLADMISDGVIGTTELADDAITPVKLDETGSYTIAQLDVNGTLTSDGLTVGDNSTSEIPIYFNSSSTDFSIGANGNNFILAQTTGDLDSNQLLTVTSTGSVGIGTSSPSTSLHVSTSAENVATFASTDTAARIVITDGTDTGYVNVSSGKVSLGQTLGLNASNLNIDSSGRVGIGTSSPQLDFVVSNNGAQGFEINSSGVISGGIDVLSYNRSTSAYAPIYNNASYHMWATSTTERMRIDSNGRVGIGTSSPSSLATIQGSSSGQNVLQLSNSAGTSDGGAENGLRVTCNGNTNWGNLNVQAYQTIFSQNGSERMRIDGSGNLGIGNTNPTVKLDVQGTSGVIGRIQSTSGDAQFNIAVPDANEGILAFGDAANYRASIKANTSDAITFQTGSSLTERMRIRGDGNIHVNSTTPDLVGNTTSLSIGGSSFGGDGMLSLQSGWGGTTYGRVFASGGTLKMGNPQSSNVELFSANLTRLKIDASGRVTKPYQPSFFARYSSTFNPPIGVLVPSSMQHNIGSHYNTSTGVFTAPVAGRYYFGAQAFTLNTAAGILDFHVNGTAMLRCERGYTSGGYLSLNGSLVVELAANDGVRLYGTTALHVNSIYSGFFGFLMG